MSRREFTKETRRDAWDRSGEVCEADGAAYGLPSGERCRNDLNLGVHYDHVDPDANSKDNSLSNCKAVCPKCHRWKTSNRDMPLIAKTDRQEDRAHGIARRPPSSAPMPGSKASGWRKPMSGPAVRR